MTALMIAAQEHSEDAVRLLAPHEAGMTDNDGTLAVLHAYYNNRASCFRILMEFEAKDSENPISEYLREAPEWFDIY